MDISNKQNGRSNNEEKKLNVPIKPISKAANKIIYNQMEKSVCKIFGDNEKVGTGFLSKIPFPDELNLLPVLITTNNILNEKDLLNNIKISFDDDKNVKIIKFLPERKIYSSFEYDTTIIEIFPEKDDIKSFLDIELSLEKEYLKEQVYTLQYPKGKYCSVSHGSILSIDEFNIAHNCSTETGSSGGPIILLNNFKVIGIHKGSKKYNLEINFGTLLKFPINEFTKKFSKINRKFLILVLGKPGVGKSVLAHEILKKPCKENIFRRNKIEFIENESDNPNFSFLIPEYPEFYIPDAFNIMFKYALNYINDKFKTKQPENYIDCIWFCFTGGRFEQSEAESIKFLREKYSKIPLLLVYTRALEKYMIDSFQKYIKELFNLEMIPVLAKKVLFPNGVEVKPYGLDILLAETIKNCKVKREIFNN